MPKDGTIKVFEQARYLERLPQRKQAAILAPRKDTALELFAGTGSVTEVYRPVFRQVITVDINPKADASYTMDSLVFLKEVLPGLGKIDLADFDPYANPNEFMAAFFAGVDSSSVPFLVAITDGWGLPLKMSSRTLKWRERYLVDGNEERINFQKPWLTFEELVKHHVETLASSRGWVADQLSSMISRNTNYVFAVYGVRLPEHEHFSPIPLECTTRQPVLF